MSENASAQEIAKIFPEVNQIQDNELKRIVVDSWAEVLDNCGPEAIMRLPFAGFAADVTLVEHITCVARVAMDMADVFASKMKTTINRDLILAAVLLHDLGKAYEYEFVEGAWIKTDIGKKFMHGFWGTYRSLVQGASIELAHLVATHTPVSPVYPQLIEGVILHYADLAHADMICFERNLDLYLSK